MQKQQNSLNFDRWLHKYRLQVRKIICVPMQTQHITEGEKENKKSKGELRF